MSTSTVAIVVVAAGSGVRLGAQRAKAFVGLGGLPILAQALSPVAQLDYPVELVVVAPEAEWSECRGVLSTMTFSEGTTTDVVVGGETRHQSVFAGLRALADRGSTADVVLVHDAARPLVTVDLFRRVINRVRESGQGVVPARAVVDTLKRTDTHGHVLETVNRDELAAVQTPQGFPLPQLIEAYQAALASGADFTDDAATFSANGGTVVTVLGEANGFKITTAEDLLRAEQLVSGAPLVSVSDDLRIGHGVDVHAFGEEQNLWLAGLHWPGEQELSGHSDGDAAAHALCDAILAAAGLGDIGSVFGTDDPRFANAPGEVFVTEAVRRLAEAGFEPVNASVQIVGNRPKFAARRDEAQRVLSGWLGAPVAVSATTSDGLGLTGEGRGIAAIATVLTRARR